MAARRVSRVVSRAIEDQDFLWNTSMVKTGTLSRNIPMETLLEVRTGTEEAWHDANVMNAKVNQMVGRYRR